MSGRKHDVLKLLGAYVTGFYAKCWILVCAGMFIVVSFAGRLVVYKIVYMFLFLLCLTLFQVRAISAGWSAFTTHRFVGIGMLGNTGGAA